MDGLIEWKYKSLVLTMAFAKITPNRNAALSPVVLVWCFPLHTSIDGYMRTYSQQYRPAEIATDDETKVYSLRVYEVYFLFHGAEKCTAGVTFPPTTSTHYMDCSATVRASRNSGDGCRPVSRAGEPRWRQVYIVFSCTVGKRSPPPDTCWN